MQVTIESQKINFQHELHQLDLNISKSILSIGNCSRPPLRKRLSIPFGLMERNDGNNNRSFPNRAGLLG